MGTKRTLFITVIVLILLLAQIWLVSRAPSWGWNSPFPFTLLRSAAMPVLIAIIAGVAAASTKSTKERNLVFSIIIAAVVEVIVIKLMIWVEEPKLVMSILFLDAFIVFQFLRYGCEHFIIAS